jgi:amino-acid N-acetyltransferase
MAMSGCSDPWQWSQAIRVRASELGSFLAVEPGNQSKGIGARLVQSLLAMAREKKLDSVYLLTTTADRYFPRFGFEEIGRDQLDPLLNDSKELQGVCPESAICMKLELG